MLVSVKYLFRDPKTGILAYRRAYPSKLRPFIPDMPQQLYVSLGVRTLNAEAQQRFDQAAAEFERLAAFARKAEAGSFDRLDEEAIKFLSTAWLTHCLEEDEADRWQPMDGPAIDEAMHRRGWREKRKAEALETIAAIEAELKEALGLGDADSLVELLGFEAQDFAESHGFRVDASSPEFGRLCQHMAEAQLTSLDAQKRRWSGETINGKKFWRLQVAGFAGKGVADTTCGTVKARGGACLVMAAPKPVAPGQRTTDMRLASRR